VFDLDVGANKIYVCAWNTSFKFVCFICFNGNIHNRRRWKGLAT